MKDCNSVYLFEDSDIDVDRLIERIKKKVESTVNQYGIKRMNIVGEATEDADGALEVHEILMDGVDEILKGIDYQGYFIWDCNFHEDGDGTVRTKIMICAAE